MRNHREVTREEWEAYLDEALPPEEMAELERLLREEPQAREVVGEILALCNRGVLSVAAVWRAHRISCPTRDELGCYLLGLLDEEVARYIECHLQVVGCRFCLSNLEDLRRREHEDPKEYVRRRKRYFESASHLLEQRNDDGSQG